MGEVGVWKDLLRIGAAVSGEPPGSAVSGEHPGAAVSGEHPGAAVSGELPGAAVSGEPPGAAVAGELPGAAVGVRQAFLLVVARRKVLEKEMGAVARRLLRDWWEAEERLLRRT